MLNLQTKVQREEIVSLNLSPKTHYDIINTSIITQHAIDEMQNKPFVVESWNAVRLDWNNNISFERANIKVKENNNKIYFTPFYRYVQKFGQKFLLIFVPKKAISIDVEVIGFDNAKNTVTRTLVYNIPTKSDVTRGQINQEVSSCNINFEVKSDTYKGYKKFSAERNLKNKLIPPDETIKFYYNVDGIKKEPVKAYIILKNNEYSYKLNLPIHFEKGFGTEEKFYSLIRIPSEFTFASIFLEYINNENGEKELFKDTFKIGTGVFIPVDPVVVNAHVKAINTVGAETFNTNIFTKVKTFEVYNLPSLYPTLINKSARKILNILIDTYEVNRLFASPYVKRDAVEMVNTDIITEYALQEMQNRPFAANAWNAIRLDINKNIDFDRANIKVRTKNGITYFCPFYKYLNKFGQKYLLVFTPFDAKYLDIEVLGFNNETNTIFRHLTYNIPVKDTVIKEAVNYEVSSSNIDIEIRTNTHKGYKKITLSRNLQNKLIPPNETIKFYYDIIDGIKKEPVKAYMVIKNPHHTYKLDLPVYFEKTFGTSEKFFSLVRVSDNFNFVSIFLEYINNENGEMEVYKDTFKIGTGVLVPDEPTNMNAYSKIIYAPNAEKTNFIFYPMVKARIPSFVSLIAKTFTIEIDKHIFKLPILNKEQHLTSISPYVKKISVEPINTSIITQYALTEMQSKPFACDQWNAIRLDWGNNISFDRANIKIKDKNNKSYFISFYKYLKKFGEKYLLVYVPQDAKSVDIEIIGYDNLKNEMSRILIYDIPVKDNIVRGPINKELVSTNINFDIRSDWYKGYKKYSQEQNLEHKLLVPEETFKFYYDVDGIIKEPVKAYIVLKNAHSSYKLELPIHFENYLNGEQKFYSLIRVPSGFDFISIFLEYINNETGEKDIFKDSYKIGCLVYISETPTNLNLYPQVVYRVNAESTTLNMSTKVRIENKIDSLLLYPTSLTQKENVLWEIPFVFPDIHMFSMISKIQKIDKVDKSIRYGAHNMDKNNMTKIINAYSRSIGYMSMSSVIRFYPSVDMLSSDDINLTITTYYGEYDINGKWETRAGTTLKYFDFEIWEDVTRVNINYTGLVSDPNTGSLVEQNINELFNVDEIWGLIDKTSVSATILAKKVSLEHFYTNAFSKIIVNNIANNSLTPWVKIETTDRIIMNIPFSMFEYNNNPMFILAYKMPSLYNTVYFNIPSSKESLNTNLIARVNRKNQFNHIPNVKVKFEKLYSIDFKTIASMSERINTILNIYVSNIKTKTFNFSHFVQGFQHKQSINFGNLTYITTAQKRLTKRSIIKFNNLASMLIESQAVPYDPIAIFKEQYPWIASFEFNRATTKSFNNLINDVLLLESTTLYGTILISYSSQDQMVRVNGAKYTLRGGEKIIFPFLVPAENIIGNIYTIYDKENDDYITINPHGTLKIQYGKFKYVFRTKYSKEQLEYAIAQELPLPQKYWGEFEDYIIGTTESPST